jgi:hypothetical protein
VHVGVSEHGKVDHGLRAAAANFAAALADKDPLQLRGLAANRWTQDLLSATVTGYGGHPVTAVQYDGADANMSAVQFAVTCSPARTVTLWRIFAYERGKWRPILGGLLHPATAPFPAASVPPSVAGPTDQPVTC